MSTQRPDAKRIYPKVRYCKPCATKRGACVLYGRMVTAESASSESCENKYYNICSVCKVSIVICGCFGFLKVLSFASFPLGGFGKS